MWIGACVDPFVAGVSWLEPIGDPITEAWIWHSKTGFMDQMWCRVRAVDDLQPGGVERDDVLVAPCTCFFAPFCLGLLGISALRFLACSLR